MHGLNDSLTFPLRRFEVKPHHPLSLGFILERAHNFVYADFPTVWTERFPDFILDLVNRLLGFVVLSVQELGATLLVKVV